MKTGTIKHYNYTKGYGFISCDSAESIFFHISNVVGCEGISVGSLVEFDVEQGDKGLVAKNISLLNHKNFNHILLYWCRSHKSEQY